MKEEKDIVYIPFVAHESAMNRMERANSRLSWIIITLLICIAVYSIVGLLIPTEIESVEQQADSKGNDSPIEQKVEK